MSAVTISIAELQELYESGKYLEAYEKTKSWGKLANWDSIDKRVFAGKLASNLGASRLGRSIHLRTFRQNRDRQNPEMIFCALWSIWSRKGPLVALNWDKELVEPENSDPIAVADRLAFRAHCHSSLRDFETSEKLICQAQELTPDRAWIYVEKAGILTAEDRLEDSLKCSQTALNLRPFYRPAVQSRAYTLVQLNRDDEAFELLKNAVERLQSGDVVAQLIALHCEKQQYQQALKLIPIMEGYYPDELQDKKSSEWLNSRKSDIYYHLGDFESAIEFARKIDSPYYKTLLSNLEKYVKSGTRKLLDLEFVRQHHVTCAPATLTAISKYWNKPVEHLDVAESICYDGTPAHEERSWAIENGYFTREFRVTWQSCVDLIDAGIPFTLTTVGPGMGHLQPVIGYDSRRRSLLVRDPGERHLTEYSADEMIKLFTSTGPRGMALVPEAQAAALKAIQLNDSELYEHNYLLQKSLAKYDRNTAAQELLEMEKLDAENRLTTFARASIAWYDSDMPGLLECTERLLEDFPDDVNQLNSKVRVLGAMGREDERRRFLNELCQRPKADPMFWQQYAMDLMNDHQQIPQSEYWIRRSLRQRPVDPQAIQLLSTIRWEQQRRVESFWLQRMATCLDDKNESSAQTYFSIGRYLGKKQEEEVVRYLKDRFERFGRKSGWPARTYASVLDTQNQTHEALQVLNESLKHNSDDGSLLLFASEFFGRIGDHSEEKKMLEAARGKCRKTDWLRQGASYSFSHGQIENAEKLLRKIVAIEPFDLAAHRWIVELLGEHKGVHAAEQYLDETIEKFPFHLGLRKAKIDFYSSEKQYPKAEKELRELLAIHKRDPWALSELATTLGSQRRNDEALPYAKLAVEIDPNSPESHQILGAMFKRTGDSSRAIASFRKAIELAIDYEPAIYSLMSMQDSKSDRIETLHWVFGQLQKQVTTGAGLVAYRDFAGQSVDPDELLSSLYGFLKTRKQLWQAWVVVIHQLLSMRRVTDASNLAQKASERFPLIPQIWMEYAMVFRAAKNTDAEIQTLLRGLKINEAWIDGLRELADAYMRAGNLVTAEKCMNRAIRLEPRNALNLGALADIQWHLDQKEKAIKSLKVALNRNPGYQWAWHSLIDWSKELDREQMPLQFIDQLAGLHPHDVRPHLMKAEYLASLGGKLDEEISAIESALVIDPRNEDAHYQKALAYARKGDIESAIRFCSPEVFADSRPMFLRACEANVHANFGDLDKAIDTMRQALEVDPDFGFGWTKLADWYDAKQDNQGFRFAAENMIRIDPHYEVALGYMGDSCQKMEQTEQAIDYYEKSIEANPEYTYGAMQAINLLLEQRQFARAESVLSKTDLKSEPAWHHSAAARIHAAMGGRSEKLAQSLRALIAAPFENGNPLNATFEFIYDCNNDAQEMVNKVLDESLKRGDVTPVAGSHWSRAKIRKLANDPNYSVESIIKTLRSVNNETEVWRAAVSDMVDFIGAQHTGYLNYFVSKFRKPLLANSSTWSAVGQAYQYHDKQKSIQWMQDWNRRSDATPKDLLPLVLTFWDMKQPDHARPVNEKALTLDRDSATPLHQLMKVNQLIFDGNFQEAATVKSAINARDFPPYFMAMSEMLDWVVYCCNCGNDRARYVESLNNLNRIFRELPADISNDQTIRYSIGRWRMQMAVAHGKHLDRLIETVKSWF